MKALTTVREAQVSDGRALYGAWKTVREYNASLDSRIELAVVAEEEFLADLDASLRRAHAATFVAERSGGLIGFGTCGLEPHAPDRPPENPPTVGYPYVDPLARRAGVGRRRFES